VIIEHESEREFLRALLQSPQFGLPDYEADPIVRRRVGKVIAETSTNFAINFSARVPVTNC
jgi:hypothetical protein